MYVPFQSPAVKHYNMRAKRTPRDYPDFVTPKQRTSRGKPLDGRGDGIEETKVLHSFVVQKFCVAHLIYYDSCLR